MSITNTRAAALALGLSASWVVGCQTSDMTTTPVGVDASFSEASSIPDVAEAREGNDGESIDGGADASASCCPRDPRQAGCLDLGGARSGACVQTCDFYCSSNWRVEHDDAGCEVWRYDSRQPTAGEDLYCFPLLDAGSDASPE